MATLTEILNAPVSPATGKKVPLLVELPVPLDLEGPFLVVSSKALLWVNGSKTGVVRSAVRKLDPEFTFRDILSEVRSKAVELSWGSEHQTLQQAIDHLASFGIKDVEVLVRDSSILGTSLPPKILFSEEVWVPDGLILVLPQDRSLFGSLLSFGGGKWAGVIHNSSRGIAFVAPPALNSDHASKKVTEVEEEVPVAPVAP